MKKYRTTEKTAHETFQNSCFGITDPIARGIGIGTGGASDFLKLGIGPLTIGTGAKIIDWANEHRLLPEPAKRLADKLGILDAANTLKDPANWTTDAPKGSHAKSGPMRVIGGLCKMVDRAGQALDLAGIALDGYQGASEQWQQDSADPSLNIESRLTRAYLQGAWDAVPRTMEAGGSFLGDALGIAGGGAIAGPPGSLVGGITLGWAGGEVGKGLADRVERALDEPISNMVDNIRLPPSPGGAVLEWANDKLGIW